MTVLETLELFVIALTPWSAFFALPTQPVDGDFVARFSVSGKKIVNWKFGFYIWIGQTIVTWVGLFWFLGAFGFWMDIYGAYDNLVVLVLVLSGIFVFVTVGLARASASIAREKGILK